MPSILNAVSTGTTQGWTRTPEGLWANPTHAQRFPENPIAKNPNGEMVDTRNGHVLRLVSAPGLASRATGTWNPRDVGGNSMSDSVFVDTVTGQVVGQTNSGVGRSVVAGGLALVGGALAGSALGGGATAGAAPAAAGGASAAGGGAAAGGATAGGAGATAAGTGLGARILQGLSMAGQVGSAIGQGRAEGRAAENQANQSRDLLEMRRQELIQQQANQAIANDLGQRQFGAQEYQRNAGNSVRAGLLRGIQDVNITPPEGVQMGQITGGLRPSAITNRESIGAGIQQQAMQALFGNGSGTQGSGGSPSIAALNRPMPQSNTTPIAPLTQMPGPSNFDRFLNVFSPVAVGLGAFDELRRTAPRPLPPPQPASGPRGPGTLAPNPFAGVRY
jgi:hypothetical protein